MIFRSRSLIVNLLFVPDTLPLIELSVQDAAVATHSSQPAARTRTRYETRKEALLTNNTISSAKMTEAYLASAEHVLGDLLGAEELATKITDRMRDYFQLDYLDQIRNETNKNQVLELIENDPWMDERVAAVGFPRSLQTRPRDFDFHNIDFIQKVRRLVLRRMVAHRNSADVQLEGIRALLVVVGVEPPAGSPSAFDPVMGAMISHEDNPNIQAEAARALSRLIRSVDVDRASFTSRFLQAPEGLTIAVFFGALANFPNDKDVVSGILSLLSDLSGSNAFTEFPAGPAARQVLEEYTRTHPGWREVVGNTDPAHRPYLGAILGTQFREF